MIKKEQFTKAQEERFLAWIRTLPSCVSGDTYNIQACHVRRVSQGAGTAKKPRLFAVPMTQAEHHIQTCNGELFLLQIHHYSPYGKTVTLPEAKEWFEEQAMEYRKQFLEMEGK